MAWYGKYDPPDNDNDVISQNQQLKRKLEILRGQIHNCESQIWDAQHPHHQEILDDTLNQWKNKDAEEFRDMTGPDEYLPRTNRYNLIKDNK